MNQYIGQSNRSLKERLREHLNYIDKNTEATGKHFNLLGQSKWDLKATVLEKVHDREVWVREERESLFIRIINTNAMTQVAVHDLDIKFSAQTSCVTWTCCVT